MMRRTFRPPFALALLVGIGLTAPASNVAAQPAAACCTITAIDARAGIVTARVTTSGNAFEFTVRNRLAIAGLRVGQAVHANFARNQVSLDGRTACCTVTKAPAPPATATQQAGERPARPSGASAPVRANVKKYDLPPVSYGEPIPAERVRDMVRVGALERVSNRDVTARVGGRDVTGRMMHLNGRQGIDGANLPDGAKRLLAMHVRKLPKGASQYYLVNPALAAQWAATHPVPPEIKPKEEKKENESDCGTISINGVVDCAEDATQAVQDEFERAREKADDWWKESTDKLADALGEAQNCFEDAVLQGPKTPVRFTIEPSIPVSFDKSSSKGGTQTSVEGTITLGVPMQSEFETSMDFFYIPCLPFVFRPRSFSADGRLTVGHKLDVSVSANGAFSKRFTIPPTGGAQIPLYVIPIMIGEVPVAVLDVSAYIEGQMIVKGEGKATGKFGIASAQTSTFSFECNGGGCKGHPKGSSAPTTTNQTAQIEGKLSVEPGLYTALQLSFDYNVLQGRAGPLPYLLGVANGCAAATATQTTGGASTASTNSALTADLDWGVRLRAEGLAGGQPLGKPWEQRVMDERHIWFGDMAPGGSTALVPAVVLVAQPVAGQASTITLRMPTCFPYTDKVHYRVSWTGAATPATNSACTWQASSGICKFDPTRELPLRLTWASAGSYSVSVQAVRDEHRTYSPLPQPAQITVTVGGAGGGGQ